ncbi:MAG: RNA polymerase factor sigma-54 [Spirochaetaceae bacterium]|nr:RNA polymerase factor sigma-54 [Spirochaetaceae bacterium]
MQFQKPVLVQDQRLRMNTQLVQSIQIMALPLLDLRIRIQEELERNPALEVLEEPPNLSLEDDSKQTKDEIEYEYFADSSDPGLPPRGSPYDEEGAEAKRRFMESAPARPESLQDHLVGQARLQPVSPEIRGVCELLIRNLDEDGFHREKPETLVSEAQRGLLEESMRLVQRLDPQGVCTAGYRESLIVQASLRPEAPPSALPVLRDYFEDLERGKYREIAKALKTDEDEIEEALAFIKTLTPFPGRLYCGEEPRYVIPDVIVKLKDNQFVIILNDEEIPVLGVDPFFADMQESARKKKGREVKQFVTENIREARWFINAIHQRNQTLLKVARAIVEFQREFFLRGPTYLRPLTLKDVAAEIEVHETTVSRTATSKYMQTEWGIFELKYFFSNSISGTGSWGSRFSKAGVKQLVREIIEKEGGTGLSDQGIADLLSEKGISLARRTVAKYRKELDIGSSYGR